MSADTEHECKRIHFMVGGGTPIRQEGLHARRVAGITLLLVGAVSPTASISVWWRQVGFQQEITNHSIRGVRDRGLPLRL